MRWVLLTSELYHIKREVYLLGCLCLLVFDCPGSYYIAHEKIFYSLSDRTGLRRKTKYQPKATTKTQKYIFDQTFKLLVLDPLTICNLSPCIFLPLL